jgi:serine protease Do
MLSRRGVMLSSLALPLSQALPNAARAAGAPVVAAIKLNEQRVTIDAMLNGRGPYTLVLDTGAVVSGVKASIAQALGLRKLRDVNLNTRAYPLYAVDELVLGGQVRQAGVAMFGLDSVGLGGDGLLAAGMVTAVDSELDFERQEWRLYPGGGIDRSAYTRLKSQLRAATAVAGSQRIQAEIELGGLTVRPIWDTGMPWPLNLDYQDARKLGLWSDTTPYSPIRTRALGVPNMGISRIVRAPTLKIGPAVYENPLILVRGPWSKLDGSVLGLPVIRTLNLSVEPATESLWVARNGLSPLPMTYNGTGVWVDEERGVVSVADVGAGSPAAKAGVKTGDVIAGVSTVREALGFLNVRQGETVTLKLKRGGQALDVRFVPTAYL